MSWSKIPYSWKPGSESFWYTHTQYTKYLILFPIQEEDDEDVFLKSQGESIIYFYILLFPKIKSTYKLIYVSQCF